MSFLIYNKINALNSSESFKLDVSEENISGLTVKTVAERVSSFLGLSLENGEPQFDLICFGKTLKLEKPLAFYGIKSGTSIYLFKKKPGRETESSDKGKKPKLDQGELGRMMVALRTALIIPSFRTMLDKLYEKEFRENILACTPGLKNDPTALAILQDPDLLALLTDPENSQKILEKHPSIADAATYLAAAFHEDAVQSPVVSTPEGSLSSNLGIPANDVYSLDDLSDDEDLGGGVDAAPPDGQHVMSPRTAQTFHNLWQRGGSNQQGVITAEMLQQAIQSTQPSTSGTSNVNASQPSPTVATGAAASQSSTSSPTTRWSRQVQQLRELGITNMSHELCVQVLNQTNGDIEAAVNIILAMNE